MSLAAREITKYDNKWYYWYRCPLLPILTTRQEDQYNNWSFHIHWFIFRCWSIGSPDIGFSVELNDQDLQIRFRFPYLITGFFIPIFPVRFHQKTWWIKKYGGEK